MFSLRNLKIHLVFHKSISDRKCQLRKVFIVKLICTPVELKMAIGKWIP